MTNGLLPQFMSMCFEAPPDFEPRLVEFNRLLRTAPCAVWMKVEYQRPVELACMLQHLQVIDASVPE